MKALIAALITLVFLFTAPAFAKGPGGAGKGVQNRERVREHVNTRSRVMKGVASDKGVKIRKMEQKRLKQTEEIKEEKQERVKEKSKKAKKGLEKQREKKSEQVQKELGKGSEKGQEARETRKKWWKFLGEGE
ncbi:MAG: hypothetical protein K8R07_07240 [Desulfobacterales bacterium]|nr:hypothetical protein [Desulfobacterales bacterium]